MGIVSFFRQQFRDRADRPAGRGKYHVYVHGSTTTHAPIYADFLYTTPAPNPLTLDGNGYAPHWFLKPGILVDIVVKDRVGNTIDSVVGIQVSDSSDATGDHLVKAASDDTVPGVLLDKLTSSSLTLTEVDAGVAGKKVGVEVDLDGYIPSSEKAAANGVATLGPDGKVPWAQIPSNLRSYTPTTKAIPALTLTSVLSAPITIPAGFMRQGSQLNSRFLVDVGAPGISNAFQWFIDGVSQSGGTYNTNQISDLCMQATRREGSEFLSRAEFRYSNGYNFSSSLVDLDPDIDHTIDIQIFINSAVTVTVKEYEVTISDAPIPGVVPGTLDGSDAPVGCVGELLSSIVPIGSHVSLTTATDEDVTSLDLTPGDWDVWGVIVVDPSASISPSNTIQYGSISLVANTADLVFLGLCSLSSGVPTGKAFVPPHRPVKVASGSSQTIHLVAHCEFSGSLYVYGNLYARRVR